MDLVLCEFEAAAAGMMKRPNLHKLANYSLLLFGHRKRVLLRYLANSLGYL